MHFVIPGFDDVKHLRQLMAVSFWENGNKKLILPQKCTEISLILPLLFTQQWLNQTTTLNNLKTTASSCEFQNYLGAVTLSSSLTQDSRSRGSVTVWAIVTPTCNIVRQQHLFSSCYNYNGSPQWNPSSSDPLELFRSCLHGGRKILVPGRC